MHIKLAMLAIQNWKKLLILLITIFMIMFMFFFGAQEQQQEGGYTGDGTGGNAQVSALVQRYEPLVAKYAAQYGVSDYIQLLLAKMMQESGGRLPDVMQSSESIGLPRNTITDPEESIDVGVKYFASVLKKAGGDVKLALQSYNLGIGFIDYAKARGGYSKEVAQSFSNMMAAKMDWNRYGDINYVDNVLRYYTGATYGVSAAETGSPNTMGFVQPIDTKVTSPFGVRIHPITGVAKLHAGIDYSCNQSPIQIRSVKKGTVTKAGWQNPNNHKAGYGQRVYVDHGSGLVTVYAHLSKIQVKVGQPVEQGQSIGLCGTTGSSTGMHLHFETIVNGKKIDPKPSVGETL